MTIDLLLALGSVLAVVLSAVLAGFVVALAWGFTRGLTRRITEWLSGPPRSRALHRLPEGMPGCDFCTCMAAITPNGFVIMKVVLDKSPADLYACPGCHAKIVTATTRWQQRARDFGIDLRDLRGGPRGN